MKITHLLSCLLGLGLCVHAAGKAEFYRSKGMQFHKNYKLDSACFYFQEANKIGMTDPASRLAWAEDLIVEKSIDKARDVLDETVIQTQNSPADLEWIEYKATLFSWCGEYGKAMNLFKAVLNSPATMAPAKLRVRLRMAEILAWQKDFNRAIKALDLILEEYPKSTEAFLIKGQILEWKGEYGKAKSMYSRALQSNPDHPALKTRLEKLAWVK